MTESERRRFHRFPFDARCVLQLGDEQRHDCELLDLSINGALVTLDDSIELANSGNSDLTLSLRGHHDGRELDMEFRVRAVRVDGGHVACRFVGTDPTSFEHLKDLVAANLGEIELLDRELTQLDYWPGLSVAPATD